MHKFFRYLNRFTLVQQICVGLIVGILIGVFLPKETALSFGFLGDYFVGALKGIAPLLVFVLVVSAISKQSSSTNHNGAVRAVLLMYLFGTFLAALVAVIVNFLVPITIPLVVEGIVQKSPGSLIEVLKNLVINMVENPIKALMEGNYIGLLFWGVLLGYAFKHVEDKTKAVVNDLSDAVTAVVRMVIRIAPLGVLGLVSSSIAETGFHVLKDYLYLLTVLIACMLIVAFIVNPLIVFFKTKKDPYPLLFTCLKESGITAFMTRSSAANIPVNMELCRKLDVDKELYTVSIPLGAAISMSGAAITITTFTLVAVNTLGIEISFMSALLLSLLATIAACGASGVAGGSLLLIPLACGLFGISDDIAFQLVQIGFIIGVLQDSTETALNSSTDALFTIAIDQSIKNKS